MRNFRNHAQSNVQLEAHHGLVAELLHAVMAMHGLFAQFLDLRKSRFSESLNLEWIHKDLKSRTPFLHVADPSHYRCVTRAGYCSCSFNSCNCTLQKLKHDIHTKLALESYQNWIWYGSSGNLVWKSYLSFCSVALY